MKELGQRRATFEAGENMSGHITAGPNEGIFFFDSTKDFPLRYLSRFNTSE